MNTRKLYYEDPHLALFSATVVSCEKEKTGYAVILDATAFYPEGGGQAADTGSLGGVRVLDTREREQQVVHYCDGPLTVGQQVEGRIDYDARFHRMQQHSGEHIVSGIIHRRWGYHNVGFHMGAESTTIDFDGIIPQEAVASLEAECNEAVWRNIPLHIWTPSPEELPQVTYRTKRALYWPVRIVEVPGCDTCACCGTHVSATGEIGMIKLLSAVNFRSGTRMEMVCGKKAFTLLSEAYEQNRQVSQAFSAKPLETGAAARRMNELLEQQKYRVIGLQRQIFAGIAAGYAGQGNVLHFTEDLDGNALRELADGIAEKCGGRAAVFCGSDEEGYAYCLAAREGDLRSFGKEMTTFLGGRGGGKPNFQQGRVSANRVTIEAFFNQ